MKRFIAATFVLLAPLLLAGCWFAPSHPFYLCPRCGPIERGNLEARICVLEPGHSFERPMQEEPPTRAVCHTCGEMVDEFCENAETHFLLPVVVKCEATGKVVEAVHGEGHPWSYTCPACGRPVIQRHPEAK